MVFRVCVMSAGFWEGRGRILPVAEPLTGQHSVPKIRPLTVITPRDFFFFTRALLNYSSPQFLNSALLIELLDCGQEGSEECNSRRYTVPGIYALRKY